MPKHHLKCGKCGEEGHNARSCGRDPKGHAHGKGEKAATAKGTTKPKPVAPNGHNPALALIDAEITKMDARLADLHRARGIVAALGLGG